MEDHDIHMTEGENGSAASAAKDMVDEKTERENQAYAVLNETFFTFKARAEKKIRDDVKDLIRKSEDEYAASVLSNSNLQCKENEIMQPSEIAPEQSGSSSSNSSPRSKVTEAEKRLNESFSEFQKCLQRARDARLMFVDAIKDGLSVVEDSEEYKISVQKAAVAEMLIRTEDDAVTKSETSLVECLERRQAALRSLHTNSLALKDMNYDHLPSVMSEIKRMKACCLHVEGYDLESDHGMPSR